MILKGKKITVSGASHDSEMKFSYFHGNENKRDKEFGSIRSYMKARLMETEGVMSLWNSQEKMEVSKTEAYGHNEIFKVYGSEEPFISVLAAVLFKVQSYKSNLYYAR